MERPISASACTRASVEEVCDLLLDDPAAAFAPGAQGSARRAPTLPAELTVDLLEGGSVSQVVELDLGLLDRDAETATMPVEWHAKARHRPLPVFHGALRIQPCPDNALTEILLDGSYRPPLRAVGHFADGLLGHRLARRSVERFLEEVAERIDSEVDRRHETGGRRPALAPERLGRLGG